MTDPQVTMIRPVTRRAGGREECLLVGSSWVEPRWCLTCGHAGCCDSSPKRHARKHFHVTRHSIIQSLETGRKLALVLRR